MARQRPGGGRGGSRLTLLFGVLAVVLAALAIFIWLRDREATREPAIPTAVAGENELIHVQQALAGEGLTATIEPRGLPPGELGVPGQLLTVDETPLYVFLFQDASDAAERAADLDPATALPPANAQGTPIATEPPHLTQQSNVIVALVGGDDALRDKVDAAIGRLS